MISKMMTYVVVVDRVTGADDVAAAAEVVVEATDDVLSPPRLKLGGAADVVETVIAVVCGLATGAVDTAELPKVRPMVLATVPAVDDVGSENPPMAGAAVVVVAAGAEAPRPKLKPPVGAGAAAVVPGAVAVAAGAPNENPPAAVLVVVLPSPKDNDGVVVAVGAPNEGGLATETFGAGAEVAVV